jgi:hypothetical protein
MNPPRGVHGIRGICFFRRANPAVLTPRFSPVRPCARLPVFDAAKKSCFSKDFRHFQVPKARRQNPVVGGGANTPEIEASETGSW